MANETSTPPSLAPAPAAAPVDYSPQISEDPHAPESEQFLIDRTAKKAVKVPSSHVPSMVLSGQFDLPASGKQYAVDKDGELVQVENLHYADAIRDGVVLPASDADVRKHVYEQKYGDSPITAGALGALRGISLGVSDPILTGTGWVKPGTLAGYDEANKPASIIGEVGGTALGMFVPVGPIAEAGKLGLMAEKATAKMLATGAAEAGLSKKAAASVIEKFAPKVAGSAVEASIYGTGGLISESALGKADFNAENLVASAGVGALFGAGLGAAFVGLKEALPFAKEAGEKAVGISDDFLNPSKNAKELIGFSDAKYAKAVQSDPKIPDKILDALQDKNKIGLAIGDSSKVISEKVEAYTEKAGQVIGDSLEAIKQESSRDPSILLDAKSVFSKLQKKSGEFAKELELIEGVSAPEKAADYATAKRFEKTYAKLVNGTKDGQKLGIDTLQKMRKDLDGASFWDTTKNTDPASIAIAKELRHVLRTEIDELATRVNPELGKTLKQANADYYLGEKLIEPIAKKAAKGQSLDFKGLLLAGVSGAATGDPKIGVAIAGMRSLFASDLKRQMVVLGTLEKANMAINKALESSTAKFFDQTGSVVAKGARVNAATKLSEFSLARSDDGKKPENVSQAYNNLQTNLQHYAANPEKTLNKLQASAMPISHTAPDTAAALTMVGSNALNFLNSKLPRKQSDPAMLQRPYLPSGTEIAKFERYLNAIEKPTEVLKNFAEGKMSREESEALKAVYPDMFSRLQDHAMSFVGANPHLPYNKKLQLGVLLDIATDPSLQPRNIMGLQSNFSNQQPQMAQGEASGAAPNQKGLQNLSFDSRIEGTEEN